MSKLFRKIVDPKWGNNFSTVKAFLMSPGFRKKFGEIRAKKLKDPSIDISKEIRALLEEFRK